MVTLDIAQADEKPAAALGLDMLSRSLASRGAQIVPGEPLQALLGRHTKAMRQMLVAATLAAGGILAVAAVVMFRLA